MSANYWDSTQRNHWTLDKATIFAARQDDLQYISEKELTWLNLHYTNLIVQLGRKLGVRQQVVATATLYFKRYYTRNPFRKVDPILVVATCTFLAAKVEECPHHIRSVVDGMRAVTEDIGGFPFESPHVAAFEFYLLEDLDFRLVAHHPYRPLLLLTGSHPTTSAPPDAPTLPLPPALLHTAWFAINDVVRTDVMLLHPPYVVALAVMFLVVVGEGGELGGEAAGYAAAQEGVWGGVERDKVAKFFAETNVDMAELLSIVHTLLRHYRDVEEYREFGEARVADLIQKLHGGNQGGGQKEDAEG
ncbi:C/H/G cyclin [Gonapodya prolifera JEL478]|uniref:C/H/G cyclin n=1 Tax=Gonapodya prolifera (strain JEL478) TaxID=1344416 RepID=A0A139ANX6_GONPJ|nr:C/H/G cyclin [Gonapodya prolifera JEL478]|eukprot:KXS18428.1 C/H/G cyclin [Gonapodya prolifera JEL478]